jgi:hypothetical protein
MTNNEIEETSKINLQFKKRNGILPVAVQETSTGQILMLASVNQEAVEYAMKHRVAAFYSTSKKKALDKRRGVWQWFAIRGGFDRLRPRCTCVQSQTEKRRGVSHF